jgi:DNA-binding NarL/FixJ family response regulator
MTEPLFQPARPRRSVHWEQAHLPPRLRQTLGYLLEGCNEKETAERLGISPYTAHDYVKELYRRFQVRTRAQLLAKWTRRKPS